MGAKERNILHRHRLCEYLGLLLGSLIGGGCETFMKCSLAGGSLTLAVEFESL